MTELIGVPGHFAYEKAREFDNTIEELEINAGCCDYYAYGFRDALNLVKGIIKTRKYKEEYEVYEQIINEFLK